MNILFLNASPRKSSFTLRAMQAIEAELPNSVHTEWLHLHALSLKPCCACLRCRPDGECVLPLDDGHHAARAIRNADALVIGSPTYFGNVSGPMKILIDRSLTAFESIAANGLEMPVPRQVGKKAAVITACNVPEEMAELPNQAGGTIRAMEIVLAGGGYEVVGKIIVAGAASLADIPFSVRQKSMSIAALLQG